MLRFWIMLLVITGVTVGALILGTSASKRWPRWLGILWVVAVLATVITSVAILVRNW